MALNKENKRIGNKRKAQDDPFLESQKIASQFDDATLKQDVDKLRKLVLSTEKNLEGKDIFFKAQMYYSLATATDMVSRLGHSLKIPCCIAKLQSLKVTLFKDVQLANAYMLAVLISPEITRSTTFSSPK